MTNSTERSVKTWIELITNLVIAMSTAAGAVVGVMAYDEYRKANSLAEGANRIAVSSQLNDKDKAIAALALDKDKPHMDAIWVELPATLKGKQRADAQLEAIITAGQKAKIAPGRLPKWTTLEELNTVMYSESAFRSADMRKLREVYLLSELILYTVNDAYQAAQEKMITPEQRDTFAAYLDDIGEHPLILSSIWYGHQGGFITKDFAAFLQQRLLKNAQAKQLAMQVYPELLADSWPRTVGTRKNAP
jgi:hypothetical protein